MGDKRSFEAECPFRCALCLDTLKVAWSVESWLVNKRKVSESMDIVSLLLQNTLACWNHAISDWAGLHATIQVCAKDATRNVQVDVFLQFRCGILPFRNQRLWTVSPDFSDLGSKLPITFWNNPSKVKHDTWRLSPWRRFSLSLKGFLACDVPNSWLWWDSDQADWGKLILSDQHKWMLGDTVIPCSCHCHSNFQFLLWNSSLIFQLSFHLDPARRAEATVSWSAPVVIRVQTP